MPGSPRRAAKSTSSLACCLLVFPHPFHCVICLALFVRFQHFPQYVPVPKLPMLSVSSIVTRSKSLTTKTPRPGRRAPCPRNFRLGLLHTSLCGRGHQIRQTGSVCSRCFLPSTTNALSHTLCSTSQHSNGLHLACDTHHVSQPSLSTSPSPRLRSARRSLCTCTPVLLGKRCDLLGGPSALLPLSAVALSSKTPVRIKFQSHRRRQDPLSPCWATPGYRLRFPISIKKLGRHKTPPDRLVTFTTHGRRCFSLVGQEKPGSRLKAEHTGRRKDHEQRQLPVSMCLCAPRNGEFQVFQHKTVVGCLFSPIF